MTALTFSVRGVPITQGSKTAIARGGRAWVIDGSIKKSKEHRGWREAVADAARASAEACDLGELLLGPVCVDLEFYLQRPVSAPKRTRTWPVNARSGDVDKLARSVLDSITGTIIADDSQVITLTVRKDWAGIGDNQGTPGVTVHVRTFAAAVSA